MDEYISRKYLEDIVDYHLSHSNGAEHYAYGIIRGEVRVAQPADVVEVKHGEWIRKQVGEFPGADEVCCSICNNFIGVVFSDSGFEEAKKDMNYCNNCGARMTGGE